MCIIIVSMLLSPVMPDDLDKLQGTWLTVSLVNNGKVVIDEKTPPSPGTITKLVYQGNKWMVKGGDKTFATGTIKIDATKSPKEIDIMDDQGKLKLHGIYKIEGDIYTYCGTSGDEARPTDFASKEGSKHTLIVSKREK